MIRPLSIAERISGAVLAVLLGLAAALVLALILPRQAHAQQFDCHDLASVINAAAQFRDARAKLHLTVKIARETSPHRTRAEHVVIEREIRLMWRDGLRRDDAAGEVYRRCRAQLGDMGRDS